MSTKVGIVYATDSGMLRYWIVPDADAEHDAHSKRVWPGESYLVVDRATIKGPADFETAIAKVTGKPCPAPVRAALIDETGTVVRVALIDPALDPGLPPNKSMALVLDDKAEIGWVVALDGSLAAAATAEATPEAPAEAKP